MKVLLIATTAILAILTFAGFTHAQSGAVRNNNPYSPSPSAGQARTNLGIGVPATGKVLPSQDIEINKVAFVLNQGNAQNPVVQSASRSTSVGSISVVRPVSPTDTYLIGVGDVILINLKNSPSGTGYYKVALDGTIDYPLATTIVKVRGLTSDAAAELLRASIKLYSNPQVEAKVERYLSHAITVTGLADNGGQKYLRREAMPLFALRAETEPKAEARIVSIRRSGVDTIETHDLANGATDNLLIFAGDTVTFLAAPASAPPSAPAYYIVSGEVGSAGRRAIRPGLTLSQAIESAGGVKAKAGKAVIRRPGAGGTRISEFDLAAIAKKRSADPQLMPGDVVEVIK